MPFRQLKSFLKILIGVQYKMRLRREMPLRSRVFAWRFYPNQGRRKSRVLTSKGVNSRVTFSVGARSASRGFSIRLVSQ